MLAMDTADIAVDEGVNDPAPLAEEPPTIEASPLPETTAPAVGETRLLLSFSGDCWTEISDATGRRLPAGRDRLRLRPAVHRSPSCSAMSAT